MKSNIINNSGLFGIKNKIFEIIFRDIIIGIKSNILLYTMNILTWIYNKIDIDLILFISFGVLNGFLNALLISIKNKTRYKIISSIIGCIVTIFVLLLSLRTHLPDILINYLDYIKYGENYNGLGAGGRFAFTFSLLIYFGISIFVSFPISLLIISKINKK